MLFYPAILLRFFIAKFHYTLSGPVRVGPDPTRTKSAHIVGDELNSTTRTRHGPERTFFAAKLRWVRAGRRQSPCGSVRVRVVEFSSYPTTCADFVRVRFVSGPCRVRVCVRVVEFSSYSTTCADFVRVRSVSGPCSGI